MKERQENLITQLKERGLIAQVANEKELVERIAQKPITLYCGFDPTADSLHLGHLVPLLCLKRFQMQGHHPIALVGGATGMIGDPSFKAVERKLNDDEVVKGWVSKIQAQVSPFLDFLTPINPACMVNNNDWFKKMDVISFLRDIGKHFSVNSMIAKESVKQRINRDEVGISFTEFAYSLLQSYDFAYMNKEIGVELQIGGNDQWGNITAGIDLTRRMNHNQVFGITVPLITKADGTKFGKTEGGAIWLNPQKTSVYKFYQFWINTADADVYKFMQYFTFLTSDEITAIKKEDASRQAAPQAQKILAELVTSLVHGEDALKNAQNITLHLFKNEISALSETDLAQLAMDGIKAVNASAGDDLLQLLVTTNLASSKSNARQLLNSNSIAVNNKIIDIDYNFIKEDKLFAKYTILRRGKKNHAIIVWK